MSEFNNVEEQRIWNDLGLWADGGHEWSKSFGTTENLWNTYLFDPLKKFRGKKILEIAPGHGRISQFLSILADELIVIDLNESCIEQTKKKLGNHIKEYHVNDGLSLTSIPSNSVDLVFSFDSFVHMHQNVIKSYVKEISRVLVNGGHGFIHHSNFQQGQDYSFRNWGGRSNMTKELFESFVIENEMNILSQNTIKFNPEGFWSGIDILSFFYRP
jgi:ubiquinone/menaquinone biosynthesis C-methylase UbiE